MLKSTKTSAFRCLDDLMAVVLQVIDTFLILFMPFMKQLTEEDETVLEIITYVGLSLSIIGIILTVILYSFLT